MKITLDLPDKVLPELQKLMDETGARNLHELFQRAIGFYLYLFRLTRGGLRLAVLNRELEIEGRLIDRQLFAELFRGNSPESDPPGKQEN
jgi:hypothetical protein